MKNINIFILINLISSITLFSQNIIPKQGGICFRVDDNHSLSKFQQYADVFDKYNQKFTFALNLADDKFEEDIDGTYKDGIKAIQENGHEIMDHTPNHRTNYFYTKFPISEYQIENNNVVESIDGVNHITNINSTKNKICLEYLQVDTNIAVDSGFVDIIENGDSIVIHDYHWSEIAGKHIFYIYFPTIDQLVFLPSNGTGERQHIEDFWRENLILDNEENVRYYSFYFSQVYLSKEAVHVLANETQKLADEYGFSKIKTWIQPGGKFPELHKEQLKESLEGGSLNYLAGAVDPDDGKQVFNEYDPNDDLKFGMQWGDFLEDEENLEYNKNIIAHDYALNHMLIGHSHFRAFDSWENYLERTDSIIAWVVRSGIPIKTYVEWADILYKKTPDPYEDIFPPLNIDYDENGVPDGFGSIFYPNLFKSNWEIDHEAPSPGGYCYSISSEDRITHVRDLGGIEKGKNNFEIWTKGEEGDSIEVSFSYVFHSEEKLIFKFPADTEEWTKYNLSQSVNGNTELIVPDTASTIFTYIDCSDYTSGDVKISGMTLKKYEDKKEYFLDLRIFLEGAYDASIEEMNDELYDFVPTRSPYLVDPQTVDEIPDDTIDWVLVELRSENNPLEIIKSRSAFVLLDGRIVDINGDDPVLFEVPEGKYYVVIKHRNHLSVMSKGAIEF